MVQSILKKSAAIISYKLVHEHLRVNRFADALVSKSYSVDIYGISPNEKEQAFGRDGVNYILFPRFYFRNFLKSLLVRPFRLMKSFMEDDLVMTIRMMEMQSEDRRGNTSIQKEDEDDRLSETAESISEVERKDTNVEGVIKISGDSRKFDLFFDCTIPESDGFSVEIKHLEQEQWYFYDLDTQPLKLKAGNYYWRVRNDRKGRSYGKTRAFIVTDEGDVEEVSPVEAMNRFRDCIEKTNDTLIKKSSWYFGRLKSGLVNRWTKYRDEKSINTGRVIAKAIGRLLLNRTMPVFPVQNTGNGKTVRLSWRYMFNDNFEIELSHGVLGTRDIHSVSAARFLDLPNLSPGYYLWRVRAVDPGSGWSRRMAFRVNPDGVIQALSKSNPVSEAFFSLFGVIVSRSWVSRQLSRVIYTINHYGKPGRFSRMLEIFYYSYRVWWKLPKKKYELWIAHDLYALPGVWLFARMGGGKYIYDAVELSMGRQRQTPPGYVSRVIITLSEKLAENASTVIAGDPYLVKDLQARHPGISPVLILNGQPVYKKGKDNYLREVVGIDGDIPIVLYIGYIVAGRGVEEFIRAASLINAKVHCIAIGPCSEPYISELNRLIRSCNVENIFSILPSVSGDKVVQMASGADIGISPVSGEFENGRYVLNNKLFQYIAAGLPVLASDVEGVGGFVQAEKIGLVFNESDPESIASCIDNVLGDSQLHNELLDRVRSVAHKYDWDTQKTIFLESVLK